MNKQLYNCLERLIVKHSIKINKEELKFQLKSHPSYPSLHAVTGVLDHFGIPNLALRLSVNQEMLSQLPDYFIANMTTENGDDLVLVEKRKEAIKIVFDTNKSEIINQSTFLEKWNGIIVAIEKDEHVEEHKRNLLPVISQYSLYALGLLGLIYFYYISSNEFMQSHFAFCLLGFALSILIVKHELGLQSEASNNFCNLSSKTSCDAVLDSKGALLFNRFKLSDISIVAFSTYCLSWILFLIFGISSFNVLALVSVCAFPVTIYSIYYQYSIIKKWCPLCLGIVAILVLQIGTSLSFYNSLSSLSFSYNSFVTLIVSTIFSVGIWSIIKPLLVKKGELTLLKVEHYKFKRDFSVFKALLTQSETLKIENYFPNELVFGNKKAPIELILVTNPLCHFCKKAHKNIENLLKKLDGKIRVIIRFNVDTSKKDKTLYNLATRLLDIYNINGEQSALKAMNEVYSETIDFDKWLHHQPKLSETSYDYTLNEQKNWGIQNAINFTPALYINNTQFPKEYDITDLIYFINDLIEIQQPIKTIATKKAFAS